MTWVVNRFAPVLSLSVSFFEDSKWDARHLLQVDGDLPSTPVCIDG